METIISPFTKLNRLFDDDILNDHNIKVLGNGKVIMENIRGHTWLIRSEKKNCSKMTHAQLNFPFSAFFTLP